MDVVDFGSDGLNYLISIGGRMEDVLKPCKNCIWLDEDKEGYACGNKDSVYYGRLYSVTECVYKEGVKDED